MLIEEEILSASYLLDEETEIPIMSICDAINGGYRLVNPDFEDGVMDDAG